MNKATYYIRIDSYWQNSPDRWVGPFDSRDAADAEIDRAIDADGSKVCMSDNSAQDIKNGVRVYGVFSKTEARKMRMHTMRDNPDRCNVIGTRIPLDTHELMRMTEDTWNIDR